MYENYGWKYVLTAFFVVGAALSWYWNGIQTGLDLSGGSEIIYTLDFGGWRRAADDARNLRLTPIRPRRVDLTRYRLVLLGSPIWLYRPAPPLWSFVQQSQLTGKRVVLFNTYNSRFKAEQIEAFGRAVARRGGRLVDHIHVRRGRVIHQLSGEELVRRARAAVRARAGGW